MPGKRQKVMAILGRLRQAGHTIVMVSHDMRLVENYADRIVRMEAGRIVPD